jgi:hypothetical protein
MKDEDGPRTDSKAKEPGPFKTPGGARAADSSNRVNFRQQSLVASQQAVRQMIASRPAAKPTFRMTLGR